MPVGFILSITSAVNFAEGTDAPQVKNENWVNDAFIRWHSACSFDRHEYIMSLHPMRGRTFRRVSTMTENRKYQKTLVACYLGFVTQAISANFAPLLYLTFQYIYWI